MEKATEAKGWDAMWAGWESMGYGMRDFLEALQEQPETIAELAECYAVEWAEIEKLRELSDQVDELLSRPPRAQAGPIEDSATWARRMLREVEEEARAAAAVRKQKEIEGILPEIGSALSEWLDLGGTLQELKDLTAEELQETGLLPGPLPSEETLAAWEAKMGSREPARSRS